MTIPVLIVVVLAVIVAVSIFKFIFRTIFRIVGFLFVAALAGYFLFYWNGGMLGLGNKDFIMYEMKKKYCIDRIDTVKCDCIIEPIVRDIEKQYSRADIKELKENKLKSLDVIRKSMQHKWSDIKTCLRDRDALDEWDKFVDEVSNYDVTKKLDKFFQELKTEE